MPRVQNRPWPQCLSWGRLEILLDRREALPCWHCHAIEPSAQTTKDCFSSTDPLQNARISIQLFTFIAFIFPFFVNWKKKPELFYLSPTLCECPDCLSLSLQGRKFYRFAKYLNIAASNSWFDRRGEGEKNFLFPFKLLLVQTEIPFKPEGLDWGLRIKENRTDRKCGFSLELYLKRVTSDSGFFFSLLHPLQNGLIFAISPAKGLNCINMCMCLQPFFVCFALYDNCM